MYFWESVNTWGDADVRSVVRKDFSFGSIRFFSCISFTTLLFFLSMEDVGSLSIRLYVAVSSNRECIFLS